MNLRYGEDVLQACQAANLRIVPLSHRDGPVEAQSREGSSRASEIAETIVRVGAVPDIISDPGVVGQEAMVWVLGHDAAEVTRKVLMIRQCLLGH
jgi:predicted fused transcriptional regulator/phosphomethylpyrimidine kinase